MVFFFYKIQPGLRALKFFKNENYRALEFHKNFRALKFSNLEVLNELNFRVIFYSISGEFYGPNTLQYVEL